ncbi:MAG: hypothetical protein GX963_00755 [Bacteroidales bacterium]|nr:hypothetical protein [Bacteroidales bacterium]
MYYGADPTSEQFWGDLAKKHFKYIRNHTFNGINTLKYDPKMPYRVPHKEKYSNYWFSSSDGDTLEEFTDLITPKNIMKLENQNGLCIVYTHFAKGFVDDKGVVNPQFKKNLEFLSSRDGWFVPAGEILDFLESHSEKRNVLKAYLTKFDSKWIWRGL